MMTYELDDVEKEMLLGAVVNGARADLNDGRPLTEMKGANVDTEETRELVIDASALAYTAIKFSGLYKYLSESEWDALADKYGKQLVAILNAAIDEELAQREAENQEMDRWLSR